MSKEALQNVLIVGSGGRVLGVTAYGADIADARRNAYSSIGNHGIHFEGMQNRKDIGLRAVERLRKGI